MSLIIYLLVIDGQRGFMDEPGNTELPVPGAVADMRRVAKLVKGNGRRITAVHATMDCHQEVHIAHPVWWVDRNGDMPAPFTVISAADIRAGHWSARSPSLRTRSLAYAEALEATAGKYRITVWPPHCRIGTPGNNLQEDLDEAIREWAVRHFAMIEYIAKGSNPFTEHYGALMAEVPDPSDPSTMLNTRLIRSLRRADVVLVAGEALSHCVMATMTQIAENIGAKHVKKFHLLRDCMSPVPAIPGVVDFPAIGNAWLRDMEKLGMTVTTSDCVFA